MVQLTGSGSGSGRPEFVRMTDSIAIMQELIHDKVMRPVLCDAPYRSKFCRLCVPKIISFG